MTGKTMAEQAAVPAGLIALSAPLPWRVAVHPGTADGAADLVIACASIGHDPARPPQPEFLRHALAGGRRAVFVSDESRSWGQAPGLAEALGAALAAAAAAGPVGRVLALGQSMGAVVALKAATLVPVDAVLAFGPQSGLGACAPAQEARWQPWAARLQDEVVALPRGVAVTLFHGLLDDGPQARGFPHGQGVDHVLFPDQGHSGLCPHLKARGALGGLIEAALAGDRRRLLRIAASAGGVRRERLWRDQEPR
jgi:hypothetical protein